jgi:hypothetical protein
MFNIKKISQRYDSREDRIEVAIQDDAGHVIRLWLTQRLSNRMVAVLAKWLPELKEEPSTKEEPSAKEDLSSEGVESESKPSSPKQEVAVNFNSASEEGLLTTIDMSHQQKDYLLTFKWGVTGIASIHMGIEQLDSFIEGLIQLYRAAQWDIKAFPQVRINTLSGKKPEFEDFPEDIDAISRTLH